MKVLVLSLALLNSPLIANANQYYPNNSSGFNVPNMNWGNSNGYGGGSNWNMPSMNWGNNNNRGSNWNMPSMNWGNSSGYGGGSNWNMPSMNWGSGNGYNSGSNWNMPNMSWGSNNRNNNTRPWNYGANRPAYRFVPNPAYQVPAPQIKSKALTPPKMNVVPPKAAASIVTPAQAVKSVAQPATKSVATTIGSIPKPSDVKGVILAPENKPKVSPMITTPAK